MQRLINPVIDIARSAGAAILAIYHSDFSHQLKQDDSPLTAADLAAHQIICDGLANISDFPVLSEESAPEDACWEKRRTWHTYWLVDPLDGTKEFIQKNDEFTVNIALIQNGRAVLGVVYCPPLDRMYFAADELGAYRQDGDAVAVKLQVASPPTAEAGRRWRLVGSRRHGVEALATFSRQLGNVDLLSMGSSLKLCLVAEGSADLYPRLAPTCEWDTAAAQAVVEHAGGRVLTPTLETLQYGQKEALLNPCFIVCTADKDSLQLAETLFAASQSKCS